MKITDKQLAFLEDYIKRKKPHFDTESRLELIDHLVCDFEENGNGNISEFLATKSSFIFNYKDIKADAVHWAYQKELWKIFFSFFTSLKTLPIVVFIMFVFNQLISYASHRTVTITYIFIIIIPLIFGLIKTYHKSKNIRNLIEFKYLVNVFSLPNLFFYTLSPFKEFWFSNKWLLFVYLFLGIGLNFSALILVLKKRKRILEKYKHLLQ